jgi:hypothetical protein
MLDDSWVSSGFILLSAIALWLAVIPMVRISRLVREHPDEMWAHRIAGTERKRLELKGGVRAAKERQVELLTAARRRAVYFSIGATLAVFAATGAATYKRFTYLHSTPFEPVARELESLWKASQTERIANLLDRGVVGNERENFLAQLRSRKWDQRLPAFTSSTVHSDDTAYRQTLFLEAGQVDLRWRWSDGAWRIRAYALPAPTARSFAERFRKVWNASDVDGVANLFRPDAVSKARRYLTRLVERREWKSGFPPLDAFQELSKGGSSAEIHFDVGEGTLIVSCEYNSNGEWYIVGLKFPND